MRMPGPREPGLQTAKKGSPTASANTPISQSASPSAGARLRSPGKAIGKTTSVAASSSACKAAEAESER
jgi:hypothetical protein